MSQPVTYTGVVAMASDRGIGYRGALPWHLPDDLKTFKRLTTGHPVLMGRRKEWTSFTPWRNWSVCP
mgnify:CR=1 FL=1